jgi:DNA-binding MarR family transcriptional regulator
MDKRQQTETRLMVVLNIIQKLLNTRQSKLFSHQELTVTQFGLLTHFTHNPERSWLVTELAEVMEMNQPGITKTVTALLEKGLLSATLDKHDRRKRHLKITQQGQTSCADTMQSLMPDISHCFSDWEDGDLTQMEDSLETLMTWLDNNRDDIKYSNASLT